MTEIIDSDYSADEFVPQSADKRESSYEEDFTDEVKPSTVIASPEILTEILSATETRKTSVIKEELVMSAISKLDHSVAEQFAMVEIAQAKDIFSSEAASTELGKSRKVDDLKDNFFQQAETG